MQFFVEETVFYKKQAINRVNGGLFVCGFMFHGFRPENGAFFRDFSIWNVPNLNDLIGLYEGENRPKQAVSSTSERCISKNFQGLRPLTPLGGKTPKPPAVSPRCAGSCAGTQR